MNVIILQCFSAYSIVYSLYTIKSRKMILSLSTRVVSDSTLDTFGRSKLKIPKYFKSIV